MLAQSLLTNKFGIKGVIGSYEKYITCIPELVLSNGNATVKETLPTGATVNCDATIGANFVFIDEEKIVHRVQLNLGKRRMEQSEFKTVADRFSTMRKEAEPCYKKLNLDLNNSRYYLITTRSFNTSHCLVLDDIVLIDNNVLRHYDVWPEQVKG